MNSESSPRLARIVLVIIIIAFALVAGFFGLRNFVRGSSDPLPTLAPTAVAIQITDVPTATATATRTSLPPTNTPMATATEELEEETATPDSTTAVTGQPTDEPTPTQTLSPTPSPTSRPQLVPTLANITGTRFIINPGAATPVPTFAVPLGTTNILLLGSDIALDQGVGRTDTMIILAVNREGPTASMVSLPRDLWVHIPGWTSNRLNTALSRGSSVGFPGGAVAQLTDTILHNFGIPIHYYA
ncbi:MAG: LCP family protein, partial [Chloroflexota bacterium]